MTFEDSLDGLLAGSMDHIAPCTLKCNARIVAENLEPRWSRVMLHLYRFYWNYMSWPRSNLSPMLAWRKLCFLWDGKEAWRGRLFSWCVVNNWRHGPVNTSLDIIYAGVVHTYRCVPSLVPMWSCWLRNLALPLCVLSFGWIRHILKQVEKRETYL